MIAFPADTSHFLQVCDETIAETQRIIRDLEACDMARGKKRRALFRARSRLGELQCAAERVRRLVEPNLVDEQILKEGNDT